MRALGLTMAVALFVAAAWCVAPWLESIAAQRPLNRRLAWTLIALWFECAIAAGVVGLCR